MYYLKYRPKTIREIDNSKVKEILQKTLESPSLPHAYLFVGQKGTGKTSAARIFAKAVNCLNNRFLRDTGAKTKTLSIEPCNSCKNCLAIDTSSSVDVIEMDAASNRGIDEVRNLIRESSFMPMSNRYRVFIIDEAHMITNDGFNALLKTLEEPPTSVIFILATTHQEKVPKTIISRCFVINFGRAKKDDIINMLKRICQNEKLSVDEKLLELLAKHSENSFRDAAKILEELVIQNKLTFEKGKDFLGILGKESLLEIINKKGVKNSLSWIDEFAKHDGNFKNLIEEMLENLRLLLLKKSGVAIDDEEINLDFSIAQISVLMRLLNEAYVNLRNSPIESIPLEIAVVEFYNLGKA